MQAENPHIAKLRSLMEEKNQVISDWNTIGQKEADIFSVITNDWCDMHNNPEAAAALGGTIVQGSFIVSLFPNVFANLPIPRMDGKHFAYNYGFNKVRIINSLNVGDPYRTHNLVTDIQDKGNNCCVVTIKVTVEIKDKEEPMMVAETLYYLGFDQPLEKKR